MSRHNNSSRYLDYGAKWRAAGELENLKRTPTARQVKYHRWLCAVCREAQTDGVPIDIPSVSANPSTRAEYMEAISDLRMRLKEQGIDPHGNDKAAGIALYAPSDDMPFVRERIVVSDER